MDIEITKITFKLKDKHPVRIYFNRTTDTGVIEPTEHPGESQPHQDFIDAMDGFMAIVVAANRLDAAAWSQAALEDSAHVTGLIFNTKEGGINVTLVAKFTNDDGSVDCPVQNKFFPLEALTTSDQIGMSQVRNEALAYMNGKYAGGTQGSLFDQVEEAIAA